MLFYLGIILLALGGFLIAVYIRSHKETGKTLICPVSNTCDTVIHSDYSRFFGIPVEFLGMAYYGIIAVSYGIFLVRPDFIYPITDFLLLGLSLVALLFSVYLTFIQAFTLRQWCTWCLISASFSAAIFFLALFGSGYGFVELLAEHHEIFLGLHLFGMAIGLGGATISDIMFFRFLKDLRISEFESGVLHTLSQIIWFALAVLVISGLGLYLPEAAELNQSAKFLVKMIVVGVIIINGALLNLLVAPNLVRISFGAPHHHQRGELRHIRKLAFALGGVSVVSWYSAFIFGLGLHGLSSAGFGALLLIYSGLLVVAVAISQVVERNIHKKPRI